MSLSVALRNPGDEQNCFSSNITRNLAKMADAAGMFEALWEPIEHGMQKAKELIEPLAKGLENLKANPERFKQYDAVNRWGTYEDFVPWVEEYLEACKKNPEAEIYAND